MKFRLLPILVLFCINTVIAQKIQYSRNTLKAPGTDNIQLVADVNGFHHLIYFTLAKKPTLHIFNQQLQLHASKELTIQVTENCDIRLLQLKNYYIIYTHTLQPSKHQFTKVDGNGTITDVSYLINNPADSAWNRSKATFQLFDNGNSFSLVSHSYFHELKKIKTTVVNFIQGQKAEVISQQYFPFDAAYDVLKEATLINNDLLILKTSQNDDDLNTLTLLKVNLKSGIIISKQFESGKYYYHAPTLRYNSSDSSFFVYSLLRTPSGYRYARSGVLMAKLNYSFNELAPVQTHPNPFRENTVSSFIVEKNQTTGWLGFTSMQSKNGLRIWQNGSSTRMNDMMNVNPQLEYNYFNYGSSSFQSQPTAVRITTLNNRLETKKDSLIKNNGNYYKIHPGPYAQFMLHNTPYLVLVEELVAKKRGLVLIRPDENNEVHTTSLRVYNQFSFLLSLLQTAGDNSFVVPFINKKEIGLMKVTLTE